MPSGVPGAGIEIDWGNLTGSLFFRGIRRELEREVRGGGKGAKITAPARWFCRTACASEGKPGEKGKAEQG